MAEPIVIIGAGPGGLSAAYHLQEDWLLLEQHDRVGGVCRSRERDGFVFDHAGHIMFTKSDYVKQQLYPMLLGDNVHWQQRDAWAYYLGTYIGYPFQTHSYGLPQDVQERFLLDAAEAAFVRQQEWPEPTNLKEHAYRAFGDAIAEQLFLPYNVKVWATPPELIGLSWLTGSGGRVPQVNYADMVHGALNPPKKDFGPNARFGYPLRGGFEALVRGFLNYLDTSKVICNARVTYVDAERKCVTVNGRERIGYDKLITTMPLKELIRCTQGVPPPVQRAADGLINTTVLCVNVAVGRPKVSDKHWIYYPEPKTVFQRIFVMSNASPYVAPPGTSSFIAEISSSKWKPVPREGLERRVIEDAIRVGYLRRWDDVLFTELVELPYAYLVQDINRDRNLRLIETYLNGLDIYLVGRFGRWVYINSDEAMMAGRQIAERLRPGMRHPAAADAQLAAAG